MKNYMDGEVEMKFSTMEMMLRVDPEFLQIMLEMVRSRELTEEFQVFVPSALVTVTGFAEATAIYLFNSIITPNLNLTLLGTSR